MAASFDTEVLIAGGGMVGLTLAAALGGAGIAVTVIEPAAEAALDPAHDGRASAIAAGSRNLLEGAGAWADMAPEAAPILDIRVSDGRPGRRAAPFFLHYDHRALAGPASPAAPFGHIVENRVIRRALVARIAALPAVSVLAGRIAGPPELDPAGIAVALPDGRRLRAPLLVAADGRDSALRQAAGIAVTRWSYPQTALVATIGHALPHHGVAHEHFLPSGPFAMLPMTDDAEGHRSSLVWTERAALAPAMLGLSDEAFAAQLMRRFGGSLGRLRLRGRRWSYPLALQHAARYVDRRLALVGDAAHLIHPIAGQGLNLGLRDVAALAEAVADARRLGLDIGAAPVLARYQRWRRFDNVMLAAVTDGLNRLFSNDLAPLRLARDLGLAAVDRLPGLKRFLMRDAMGVTGTLPRLIRGEPL
jgi:2-octaprenyl-6-methoxyphenol hydroxylase